MVLRVDWTIISNLRHHDLTANSNKPGVSMLNDFGGSLRSGGSKVSKHKKIIIFCCGRSDCEVS
ncbi:MAG: hypothetical protein ACYSTN_09235 [Planctomycetota bacterium]